MWKRRGFTLIELLVVIAIIAVLIGLLLPAIQKVRDAAARTTCSNNIKQIGLGLLNFESSMGHFPRSGEHLYNGAKTQCMQSPLTMILPFIEQEAAYRTYSLTERHNEGSNVTAMNGGDGPGVVIKIYTCPKNPLRQSNRDSNGYGCTDYAILPYVDISGTNFPSAMTSLQYPSSYYQTYTGGASDIKASKKVQLKSSSNLRSLGIDINYGGATINSIRDGSSNSVLLYEDVGRNETMHSDHSGYDAKISACTGCTANAYLDPVLESGDSDFKGRRHWRWAEPDSTSGASKIINNNQNPYGGPTDCPWVYHDCGPNNEWFSFHTGGANACMADGSVKFVKDTTTLAVLQAMSTSSRGETLGLTD